MNAFQEKIIEQARNQPHKLTTWEADYINDMDDKGEDYELSGRQNHILNEIGSKLD